VERKNYLTPEFLAKVALLEPVKWLPKLSDRQVRIQIIDEAVRLEKESLSALEAAAPREVKVVHYKTVAEHKAANEGRSFQWVKDQLQAPLVMRESVASMETSAPASKP